MFFSCTSISNKNQIIQKKQNYQIFIGQYSLRIQYRYKVKKCEKRTFYTPSGGQKYLKKASLTVEAAMVFPIFLLFFYLLIYGVKIVELQSKIQYALDVTAVQFADYAIAKNKDIDNELQKFTENLQYSKTGAKILFEKNFRESAGDSSMFSDSLSPFSFANSEILNENREIYLEVKYKIKIPGIWKISDKTNVVCVQNACVRAFVGRDSIECADSQIVYIAQGEQVYHTSADCSYLKPSIINVNAKEFINNSKYYEKYTSCARCRNYSAENTYYITKEGTKYHKSILCKSLKRTIERITLKQVKNRRLCSRCSKKGG